METKPKGQVQISNLIFTNNWEDPIVDEKVMQIKQDDTLFAITSGGCNVLGFLRFEPKIIYCVDINPAQNYLMELKQAAFRRWDYPTMISFFGLTHSKSRLELYKDVKGDLSVNALQFWNSQASLIKKGILMNGRFERFVKLAGSIIRIVQGQKKSKKFFDLKSLEEQREFFFNEWNNKIWKWIFRAMFNKKRLAKKGLVAEYFHFDDGSSSFSESFQKRAAHAFCELPAKENYFLKLYLLGNYGQNDFLPPYLQPQNFEKIKSMIDRIQPITADSKYWLEQQPHDFFDAMALSNICELMDEKDTEKLFSEVLRTAKDQSRIVFRNLMISREVPEIFQSKIIKDLPLSREIQFTDRSFVYGKVAAYQISK